MLITIWLIFHFINTNAQQYTLKHLNNKDGLSNNFVTCLFQDSKGIVWIGTTLGLNTFDGHQIKAFIPNLKQPYALKGNYIKDIIEDKNGVLWISSDAGLAVFDYLTQRFYYVHRYTSDLQPIITSKLLLDNDGNCWLYQTSANKIHFFKIQANKNLKNNMREGTVGSADFSINKFSIPEEIGTKLNLFYFHKPQNSIVFAGTNPKFFAFNLKSCTSTPINIKSFTTSLEDGTNIILSDKTSILPIIPPDFDYQGLLSLHQTTEIITLPNNAKLLSRYYDKNIYDVSSEIDNRKPIDLSKLPVKYSIHDPSSFARMIDIDGNLWIGTAGNGLYLIRNFNGFNILGKNSTFFNMVYLGNNTLWQGMYNQRQSLQLTEDKLINPPWLAYLKKQHQIDAVLKNPNNGEYQLMVSTSYTDSIHLYIFNPINQLYRKTSLSMPFVDGPVMLIDQNQHTWVIGSKGNVARFNPVNQLTTYWNFSNLFPKDKHHRLIPFTITQSANQVIWCSFDEGILSISPTDTTPNFRAWHNYHSQYPVFSNNGFTCIYPDPQIPHILWLGSSGGGLCKFNTLTNEEVCFTNDTKPFHSVGAIQPDHLGNLWISSEKGLSCFNIENSKFIGFNFKDYFSSLEFIPSSSLRIPENKIAFGLWNGLLVIEPGSLLENKNITPIHLAEININGIAISPSSTSLTQKNDSTIAVHLKPHEKNISLRIAKPGINNSDFSTLQFLQHNDQNNWTPLKNDGLINLNNMPYGKHHLTIRQTSGKSTQYLHLNITIQYPWFISWPARILYAISLCFIILLAINRYKTRINERHTAQINAQEIKRLQFIDDYRKRFITYLTHEFKTPLTIILGLTEMMKHNNKDEFLIPIYRESNQMLSLVSEMIDIIKVEDGSVKPQFSETPLNDYLNNTLQAHASLAAMKNIVLTTSLPEKETIIAIDPIRTRYIINNLISNAIRFSPENETIDLTLSNSPDHISIAITNKGPAIDPEDLPRIFDKYFQSPDQNTNPSNFGVGLAFVKELVTILNGTIQVQSNQQHTIFTVNLPPRSTRQLNPHHDNSYQEILVANQLPNFFIQEDQFPDEDTKPTLLICDDNPVILSYLDIFLKAGYEVLKARNGQEGFELAQQNLPDLIITDVMMPNMNGLELTKSIKKHPLTCHIPIIMISGKDQSDDIISGKAAGADAYLTKPFHFKELLLTLRNIQSLKKQWKDKYSAILDYAPTAHQTSTLPEENNDALSSNNHFIAELMTVFEQHYQLDSFDLNQMAKSLLLSRTQLYRKIASFSTESPMAMLRNFRLNKAAQLLSDNPDMSINDVANATGFKERTHFTALFVKKFHLTPSEWRKHTAS